MPVTAALARRTSPVRLNAKHNRPCNRPSRRPVYALSGSRRGELLVRFWSLRALIAGHPADEQLAAVLGGQTRAPGLVACSSRGLACPGLFRDDGGPRGPGHRRRTLGRVRGRRRKRDRLFVPAHAASRSVGVRGGETALAGSAGGSRGGAPGRRSVDAGGGWR